MLKSIIYKEWIKTRWFILLSAVFGLVSVLNIAFGVHSGIGAGAAEYFNGLIVSNEKFFALMRYVPIAIALLIGLSQYIPEVTDKRIKLSLHLPLGSLATIYSMVLYGFVVMSVILIVNVSILVALLSIDLPWEIIQPALITMLPWLYGGVTAYFLIAMISLEPIGIYRFFYAIFAYFYIGLFIKNYPLGNVQTIMPILLGAMILASLSPIYTSHRFNKGEL